LSIRSQLKLKTMLKIFALFTLLQIAASAFTPANDSALLNCPAASNLHKTGLTSTTYSCAWDAADNSALEYKVMYVRSEDNYSSATFTTSTKSFTFTGLTSGHYTFYVQVVCSGQSSEFIGIEDFISA